MTEADWRFGLKVGDEVIVLQTNNHVLANVTRVTQSQVSVGDRRFMRKTGREIGTGNNFYAWYIQRPTPEAVAKIKETEERSRLADRVVNLPHWTPTETLRAMVALLDAAKEARGKEA